MMKYMQYLDKQKGMKIIQILYNAFYHTESGLFGIHNDETILTPKNMKVGSEDHLRWITLLSALDYSRDADRLWKAGSEACQDKDKKWIFDPFDNRIENYELLKKELMTPVEGSSLKIAQRNDNDTKAWQTISRSIKKILRGSIKEYIKKECSNDAIILYFNIGMKFKDYFPYLSGPKILAMWIRLINKYARISLKNTNSIPLPVDVHVARSTIYLCGRGKHTFSIEEIRKDINLFWEEIAQDLKLEKLDFDELLFFQSKEGCKYLNSSKNKCEECLVKKYCIAREKKAKVSPGAKGVIINE